MTIEVVTRSVYMQSMFEITVEYLSAQIGPTFQMKTGAEMNYIDVASLRDGRSLFNSVTFVGTEPIFMTYAAPPGIVDESYHASVATYSLCPLMTALKKTELILEACMESQAPSKSSILKKTVLTCMDLNLRL
ncbi:hypothetical protein CAEBREN_19424 [Caenorhabditis brenneri]|uniref:Uncharacterized protein n=1 Tax=Caenorhabditis brenneri TaxID=135651 RepID=G0N1D2_CAEBE|nr:hypothetical protein CAEBREN_19424 [Caenorhabditis brenneri]